jgi:CDP-paratose 2-epimerase
MDISMKFLIFGGCGFLGSNLASEVIKQGHELTVYDNLSRLGSENNLLWLQSLGKFQMIKDDVQKADKVASVVNELKPDVIFHTAGQVAMTTSLENPRSDFETNVLGTFNVLEAIRLHSPKTAIFFSSTNKVYGDLEDFHYKETATRYICEEFPNGFSESLPLDFRTPYGCSKGAADQYIKDYALCYGLKTVVFRHSSIFGGRQFSTKDQGWIGWFVKQAIDTKQGTIKEPFTISGNGKQVRDVLFASDIISCYFDALKNIDKIAGQTFNIGGGFENSLSLLELFGLCNEILGIEMKYKELPPRQSDQKVFIADISKAEKFFGWKPTTDKVSGLKQMISWVEAI